MGPTASGKSALSLQLAEQFISEIISVDASLVYQNMDIGTAKPQKSDYQICPHHLIDILPPTATYSVSAFVADAIEHCEAILKKGKLPMLVGGTMMYFKALQEGLTSLPSQDEALRERLYSEAKKVGWKKMHQQLEAMDSDAARRIHPNDQQRILRALEICYLTDKTRQEIQAVSTDKKTDFTFINIVLFPEDRARLHRDIERRFDGMIEKGLIEEVKQLKQLAINPTLPSMKAVGYRQVLHYLNGDYDKKIMREKAIIATRQLAKRQMTWLRKWPGTKQFSPYSETLLEDVLEYLEEELATPS